MKSNNLFKSIIYWLILGLIASVIGHFAIELLQRIRLTSSWPSAPLFVVGTSILFLLYTFLSTGLGNSTLGEIEGPIRFVGVLVSGISLVYIGQLHQNSHKLREYYAQHSTWTFEHQSTDFQRNGFMANMPDEPMDEPKGNSKEKIE